MRLLVVEDQPKVAAFIVKGLQEEGWTVDLETDGEAGLRAAQSGRYDLIIQDIMLPGIDGFTAIEALRKSGSRCPILALSARDEVEDRIRGLNVGADDYLAKPFAFGELLARVKAILRRGKDNDDGLLHFADIELNPILREVRRGGQKINLTVKEFALLELLMRNPNRVLTRTTIMEKVWEISFDTETNIVEAFIRLLRKKIDADFEPKVIRTVRGVGYRISLED